MTTILAIDFDKWASRTYAANFPDTRVECARVESVDLPYADIITGGPPRQGFSTAGDGLGEKDERNGWPAFVAKVANGMPRMFLAENVPGMLSAKHIGYFGRILSALDEAGYVVEWRVQDAVSFGVPQFRERIWIWGIRRDLYVDGIRHCFPKPTHVWPPPDLRQGSMFGGELLPGVTVGQALGLDGLIKSHADPARGTNFPASTLRSGGNGHDGCCVRVMGGGRNHPNKNPDGTWRRDERDITGEPSTTISSSGFALSGGVIPRVHYDHGIAELSEPCPTIKAGGNVDASGKQGGGCPPAIPYRWSNEMLFKHPPASPASPAPTVQAKWFKGGAEGLLEIDTKQARTCRAIGNPSPTMGSDSRHHLKHDGRMVRRLTPDECMRLQSAPDSFVWPEGMPKTAKYKVAGNGWACAHAAAFSRALKLADPDSRTVIDLFCGGGLGASGWHQKYWKLEARHAI